MFLISAKICGFEVVIYAKNLQVAILTFNLSKYCALRRFSGQIPATCFILCCNDELLCVLLPGLFYIYHIFKDVMGYSILHIG